MLKAREAAKQTPNRWHYLNKNTGTFVISYGGNPVLQTRVITGINKGDGSHLSEIFTNEQNGYDYLRKTNSQTTPAGILVMKKIEPHSSYGTQDYFTDKRATIIPKRNEYGEIIRDSNAKIIADYKTGEPMIRFSFAGDNTILPFAGHATPTAKAAKAFNNPKTITGSAGCMRFNDGTLRYLYDNNLLSANDTLFSVPGQSGNYLYVDDNNKV